MESLMSIRVAAELVTLYDSPSNVLLAFMKRRRSHSPLCCEENTGILDVGFGIKALSGQFSSRTQKKLGLGSEISKEPLAADICWFLFLLRYRVLGSCMCGGLHKYKSYCVFGLKCTIVYCKLENISTWTKDFDFWTPYSRLPYPARCPAFELTPIRFF